MSDDYKGMGHIYEGEPNHEEYAAWLRSEYGDVPSRFPPASVVCFEGDEVHEFVVVSYFLRGDTPSVGIVDMAESGICYEDIPEKTRRLCPDHELPKLRYLYNLNGEKVASVFQKSA